MKKVIIGIAITTGSFLLIIMLFKILGGDSGQADRSEWYPLTYIVPVMAGLFFFFMYKENQK